MLGRGRSFSENPQNLESLSRQVASLRRENRFLKLGLVACFLFASLPYLLGFQRDVLQVKTVKTERIEFFRDGKTVVAIVPAVVLDGLYVQDSNEQTCIYIGHGLSGGRVTVFSNDHRHSASLTSFASGSAGVDITKDLTPVVQIRTEKEGGVVIVCNSKGESVAQMRARKEGGVVGVCNNKGNPVAEISAVKDVGRVVVANNEGKNVAAMCALSEGGAVGVHNNEGIPVGLFTVTLLGGALELRSHTGRTLFSAP